MAPPTSCFDVMARVLTCPTCGAPVNVPEAGGTVECGYCRRAARWSAQQPARVRPVSGIAPIDELARLRRLRGQADQPLMPPASLRRFVVAGQLPDPLVDEALAAWQTTRAQVVSGRAADAAERLFFLTVMLADAYGRRGDERRVRALLESAAELVGGERERQVLHCMMARRAVAAGDRDAARGWLLRCDPQSDDLVSDTAYRFSVAYLATAEGQWSEVFRVIGEDEEALPIAMSSRLAVSVLRANALERTARLDVAVEQLSRQLAAGHATPSGLDSVRRVHVAMDLAPRAVAQAVAQHAATASTRGSRGRWKLWGAMLPQLLVGAGFFWWSYTASPDALTDDGYSLKLFAFYMGCGFVGLPLLIGLFSALFGGGKKRLLATGIDGHGRILSAEATGWRINEVPQIRLELEVFAGDLEPVETTIKVLVPEHRHADLLRPGATIPLKVDPRRPRRVVPVVL